MGIRIKIEFRGGLAGKGVRWFGKPKSATSGYYTEALIENALRFENSDDARDAFTETMSETNLDTQASKIFFVDDNGEETMVFDVDLFLRQLQKYKQKYDLDFNPRDFVV